MADALRITVDALTRRMEAGEDFTRIDVRNPQAWAESDHASRSHPGTAGELEEKARRKPPQNPQQQTCSGVLRLTRRRL
jgi:hypothetical protein